MDIQYAGDVNPPPLLFRGQVRSLRGFHGPMRINLDLNLKRQGSLCMTWCFYSHPKWGDTRSRRTLSRRKSQTNHVVPGTSLFGQRHSIGCSWLRHILMKCEDNHNIWFMCVIQAISGYFHNKGWIV